MDSAVAGLLVAVVGVGGTLGSAWLTQRRGDASRREEWERLERTRLAELTARPPKDQARRVLASDVRTAVPDHAERILTDPAWPALATVLADAEARGHQPHQLLTEAAAQRELTTARQPARVLITRIQHTGRNPAPNRRAEAARLQTTTAGSIPTQQTRNGRLPAVTPSPTEQQHRQRR